MTSELAAAVDAQLAGTLSDEVRRELWTASTVDRLLWKGFGASGWFAALLPPGLDGLGLRAADVAGLFEVVGRRLVPGPFLEHVLLVPLLAEFTGALPAPSERLLSWWDPEATSAAPVRLDAGGIRGVMDGVRFAADADGFLVVTAGPSIVLVPRTDRVVASVAPGVTDGMTKPGRLELHEAPAELLLSGRRADDFLARARDWSRVATALELSGTSAWLAGQAAEFVKVREQFGRPIGQFQAIAHIVADLAVHDIALRNLCAAVVADGPTAVTAMGAKAYAAQVAVAAAENTLQAHGGIGFTMEHPLHMYFKHALHLWAWYGDPRRLAIRIGHETMHAS